MAIRILLSCLFLGMLLMLPMSYQASQLDKTPSAKLMQQTSSSAYAGTQKAKGRMHPKRKRWIASKLTNIFQRFSSKPTKGNTDTIAALSLGAGMLTALFFILAQFVDVFGFISIFTGLLAVGLGIAALIRLKRNPEKKGKGMAIAGLGLGGLWILVLGVVLFFFTGG